MEKLHVCSSMPRHLNQGKSLKEKMPANKVCKGEDVVNIIRSQVTETCIHPCLIQNCSLDSKEVS